LFCEHICRQEHQNEYKTRNPELSRGRRDSSHTKRNINECIKILVGKPFGRPKRRWKDNIKMDLREIGLEVVEWIYLAQDKVQ
jgi:hypothetical protein